jgi:hypothetical protein
MENSIQNEIWIFWVPGYAVWTNQCTSIVLKVHQQSTAGILTFLCYCLFGWHPNLLGRKGRTCVACQQSAEKALGSRHQIEVEKMQIPCPRDWVLRTLDLHGRDLYGLEQGESDCGMAIARKRQARSIVYWTH